LAGVGSLEGVILGAIVHKQINEASFEHNLLPKRSVDREV